MQSALSKRCKSLLVVLALLGVFQVKAWAQADAYPNRPIKLIITWPVGGFADTLGRTVATQLGPILGQQVVVENRGGANGMIGADAVAKGSFVTDAGRMLHEGMWGGAKNSAARIKNRFGVTE